MVKIVSVLLSMFTSENVVEKRILARQLSSPPCIAHYQGEFERNHNALILTEDMLFVSHFNVVRAYDSDIQSVTVTETFS